MSANDEVPAISAIGDVQDNQLVPVGEMASRSSKKRKDLPLALPDPGSSNVYPLQYQFPWPHGLKL